LAIVLLPKSMHLLMFLFPANPIACAGMGMSFDQNSMC
jgi:hypothetical protein